MEKEKINNCCICGKPINGDGNNPYPVVKDNDARCCDKCNIEVVVQERLRKVKEQK